MEEREEEIILLYANHLFHIVIIGKIYSHFEEKLLRHLVKVIF